MDFLGGAQFGMGGLLKFVRGVDVFLYVFPRDLMIRCLGLVFFFWQCLMIDGLVDG